jgi:hypothetical protein
MILYEHRFLAGFSDLYNERFKVMVMRLVNSGLMALLALTLLTQSGCLNQPKRITAPSIDAEAAGQEAIKLYDANKDNKISGAELDKVPCLIPTLAIIKSTKEKGVTAADITARIKAWQQTRIGRMGSVIVSVTRNGKPLVGAEVKFVPEKFMGDNLPICTSTSPTGPDGKTEISEPIGPGDPKGVPPGYYRVEITMPDGSVPAKYNTQTIYGEEIYPDIRRMSGEYLYDIK